MTGGLVLGFDTSSAAVTAAVHDGARVLAEHTEVDALRHGELLAPAIDSVLRSAGVKAGELNALAVGVGPGPFTGLRVGVVTARMMGDVLDIPVIGLCSLDVVAAAVEADESFLVATDARRREVYWTRYDASGLRLTAPAVAVPMSVATEAPVAGRGASLYPAAFPRGVPPEYPSAAVLAGLLSSKRVAHFPPQPLYLRRPDIAAPRPPKQVL